MIELGKKQLLKVNRLVSFGAYLGDGIEEVLLPNNQFDESVKEGNEIEVFIYKDSEDRIISTKKEPKIKMGELAILKVVDKNDFGAFLDWGLEKDLFLPFKEQTAKVEKDREYLVSLYVDKSERLCATMDISRFLASDSEYKKDNEVEGIIYEIRREIGILVAVDSKYFGLVPRNEFFDSYRVGDIISCRVIRVREDGKLDLSPRQKSHIQMKTDSDIIFEKLEKNNGYLPFSDSSSPEEIKKEFKLSKKAFKRAIGKLFKEGKIIISEDYIKATGKK